MQSQQAVQARASQCGRRLKVWAASGDMAGAIIINAETGIGFDRRWSFAWVKRDIVSYPIVVAIEGGMSRKQSWKPRDFQAFLEAEAEEFGQ